MIARRHALAGLLAFAAAPAMAAQPLLDRALAAAGGRAALEKAKVLRWTGEAAVLIADRPPVEIGLRSVIQPFGAYRTDSWLKTRPDRPNALIIEDGRGFIERAGQARQPMPMDMFAHENAQYALYGLMRLVTLAEAKVTAGPGPQDLTVDHPKAPRTILSFDVDGRLAAASNSVPSPEGKTAIAQTMTFAGEIADAGVRWPRVLSIAEDGRPYFKMTLATFSARPA